MSVFRKNRSNGWSDIASMKFDHFHVDGKNFGGNWYTSSSLISDVLIIQRNGASMESARKISDATKMMEEILFTVL